jgi:DNA invertase Pin-like site-specific DNA recombinase
MDVLAACIWLEDGDVDHCVSGARTSHRAFDEALSASHDDDTLVITSLDRRGRSTQITLALAEDLGGRGHSSGY